MKISTMVPYYYLVNAFAGILILNPLVASAHSVRGLTTGEAVECPKPAEGAADHLCADANDPVVCQFDLDDDDDSNLARQECEYKSFCLAKSAGYHVALCRFNQNALATQTGSELFAIWEDLEQGKKILTDLDLTDSAAIAALFKTYHVKRELHQQVLLFAAMLQEAIAHDAPGSDRRQLTVIQTHECTYSEASFVVQGANVNCDGGNYIEAKNIGLNAGFNIGVGGTAKIYAGAKQTYIEPGDDTIGKYSTEYFGICVIGCYMQMTLKDRTTGEWVARFEGGGFGLSTLGFAWGNGNIVGFDLPAHPDV